MLAHAAFTKSSPSRPAAQGAIDGDAVSALTNHWLFSIDAPEHSRIRRAVHDGLRRRMTKALQERIDSLAQELVNGLRDRETVDLVADLALPLPVAVISMLVGLPEQDRARLARWSRDLTPLIDLKESKDSYRTAVHAAQEVLDYLQRLADERRHSPADDLLSDLANAPAGERRLAGAVLSANVTALLLAGHETTAGLIGTAALALAEHPEQWRRLKRHEVATSTAVEEFLRYEAPIQMTTRYANADVRLGGRDIRRGEQVCLLLGAANRDPSEFASPDRLDISRTPNRHLGFGHGSHHCLGGALARFEARAALRMLADAIEELEIVGDGPVWKDSPVLRALHSLPLRLRKC